ncbi:thioredoxin-like protein [Phytophthora infestans T30-4]|uniref:Sulfhydryl oxidase n=1 Tax=Phytophthora infestans (strain T30-4) TaxID=403677 RepID=D0P4F0_PHYIT|nr:thioredoxin-like protein [Phytophthora infestans T30-4]EEY65304.1 thioredoxin-like protein [Phytophthora infestans T30-4]|eukprot:XP_002894825.1 thioredoxin-like protein [Phytophthora infestans T30-4]
MLNDTQTVWLVDFYSPWCPHCRQFAPQWEEVANVYAKVKTIQLGAVDCTKQNEICGREDVHSYPAVKMFHVPPDSIEAIEMPHDDHVYARHVAKWIEETLKEHGMGPFIDVDKVYPKNTMRNDLKKKEFKFGDPVEPLYDDRSAEIQLKRLKDAGTTALFVLKDGFFMGTTELAGERYAAAVTWVQTLANAFPTKENRAAFVLLVDMMKKQSRWKQADWNTMLDNWKVSANAISYPTNLFASKDELSLCTTFTCGLWTLEIMIAIRLVVKHFFGCEECKRHFLKANPESLIEKLALRDEDGSDAVAFWIWTMHNTVNKVLSKPRWPTNLSCPNCYFANDQPPSLDPAQLSEEDIVAYVKRFTSMAAVALLIAIFATIFQQHKHRLAGMKVLKTRDHIA